VPRPVADRRGDLSHVAPESSSQAGTGVNAEADRLAFSVAAGYFVIPDRLELAARFEWYDPDREVQDPALALWAATGGVNWYVWGERVKAQLDYTHRHEREATAQLANDIVILQAQVKF